MEESKNVYTREEAEEKLKSWARYLEIDTESKGFIDVLDALTYPVMRGRLDFDVENEVFRYRLLKPITYENSPPKEILEIRELDTNQKRAVQKYKENENIDMVNVLYAKAAGLEIGEAGKIKGRDFSNISAIVLGFFA